MAGVVEWVLYRPPKSMSFGHGPRLRDHRKAWTQTKSFLADLTDSSVPESISLSCRAANQWLSAAVASNRLEEASRRFGSPTTATELNGATWDLRAEQLEDAIDFEIAAPKTGENELAPSRLFFGYKFHWRTPWDRGEAGELRKSSLLVHLDGGTMLLQPHFVFLASIESTAFREQLTAVEHAAPFKFSDRHFKRWVFTLKRGNAGRVLKAPKNWRESWRTN